MSDYIYYRYRPVASEPRGTIYRLSSQYRTGGASLQQVYDWRTGEWESTDLLVHKLIRGDVWLDRLDYDPTTEPVGTKGDVALSMMDTVEFLIDHPEYVDETVEGEYEFAKVKELLPWTLEKMINSGRRWVLILEILSDPTKYVQVLVTRSGSMWAECVSNNFLDDGHRLDETQCELLPTLGWEWDSPPAHPNWHLHDELLDTGPVMSGLMVRTLRRVFGVEGDDRIKVITREVMENVDPVEQR